MHWRAARFFGLSVALSVVAVLALITAVFGPAVIHSHALSRNSGHFEHADEHLHEE
jgi:hypothetical protein